MAGVGLVQMQTSIYNRKLMLNKMKINNQFKSICKQIERMERTTEV